MTGRRNLELLAAFDGGGAPSRIDAALDTVELSGRAGDRVGGYSHGMRQRLGLAAALLRAVDVELRSHVVRIGDAALAPDDLVRWEDLDAVDESPVRCARADVAERMIASIDRAKGGIYKYKTRASVDGETAVEADLMCTMRKVS